MIDQTNEQIDALHGQWASHPITKLVVKALQLRLERMKKLTTHQAVNVTMPDNAIRFSAIQAYNTEVMLGIVTDLEVLKKALMQPEPSK